MKLLTFTILLGAALASIGLTIYGIYLSFSASIILGILVLLIEPSALVLGVLAVLGHPDVAQKIAQWLGM